MALSKGLVTPISKFGQEVRLEVFDEGGALIFNAVGLRIDFEVRILAGYNRAKFTLYNLNDFTIKQISTGQRFVRLFVQLHDRAVQQLNYDFYVNNSVTVKNVPNSLTELYCISTTERDFTSKNVQVMIKNPTLRRYCEALARKADPKMRFKFQGFPKGFEDRVPLKPTAVWSGTVRGVLEKLGRQYSFIVGDEVNKVLKLIFLPTADNQKESDKTSGTPYKLKTVHMRANPRIGLVQLDIESNLDFNIRFGTILDTSNLVAQSAGDTFEHLTQIAGMYKAPMEGRSKYTTTTIVHTGSNYADIWTTTAMAIKAMGGTKVPSNEC